MPRRQSDNDLVKGAGVKAPLKVKRNFRRSPHPKGSTSAATWHAGVEDGLRFTFESRWRKDEAMTDKELQRLEHDTLDELSGVMYRASLLHTGMTEDEYLKHLNGGAGAQQFMYEQLYGPVASLCMSGNTPDDIVPALIRHAVELAVMDCDDRDEARKLLIKSMDKYWRRQTQL
jgi:hypothetical protein